jgi:hypothetical protein
LLLQSHATKYRPVGTAMTTPSVPLRDAGEAALPGEIGALAPKELTASQLPAVHMNKSLAESANATELPSNTPPKADCRPSNGSVGQAGVMGVEGNVKREAIYLQKGEEAPGATCRGATGRTCPLHAALSRGCRRAAARREQGAKRERASRECQTRHAMVLHDVCV